jgi:hypothetical protein
MVSTGSMFVLRWRRRQRLHGKACIQAAATVNACACHGNILLMAFCLRQ